MSGNHKKTGMLSALPDSLQKREPASADFAKPDNGASLQALPEHNITLSNLIICFSLFLPLSLSIHLCLFYVSDQVTLSSFYHCTYCSELIASGWRHARSTLKEWSVLFLCREVDLSLLLCVTRCSDPFKRLTKKCIQIFGNTFMIWRPYSLKHWWTLGC